MLRGEKICADCLAGIDMGIVAKKRRKLEPGLSFSFWRCFPYRGKVKEILRYIKLHQQKDLMASLFCRVNWEILPSQNYEAVAYVPSGYRRFFERGYNPAHILAKILSAKLGLPVVRLLRRRAWRGKQSLRSRSGRLKRLTKSIFCLKAKESVLWRGKKVLLVDDVLTSGATLYTCSRLLQLAEIDVDCLALSYAVFSS